MANKKKWIIGCASLLVLTSLIAVYASMTSSGRAEVDDSDGAKEIVFDDVLENDWFYDDVQYVMESGLMTGTDEDSFSPNGVTTRGMIVTVLWRNEGSPKTDYDGFNDITSDKYYYQAVSWAFDKGVVSGHDSNTFGAEDYITREQLAAIMFRYANFKGYDTSKKEALSKYSDIKQISDYAISAFEWANANKIITGTSETTLEPQGNALRSQVAAILRRFCSLYVDENESENKTDVSNSEDKDDSDNNTKGNNGVTSSHNSGNDSSTVPKDKETIYNDNLELTDKQNIEPAIIVQDQKAKAGDTIEVKINIANNPGILGMALSTYYDDSNLEIIEATNGEAVGDVLDLTPSKTITNGSRFVWDGVDIKENQIKDGSILILKIKISGKATPGEYPITLKYGDGDIVDYNLHEVAPQLLSGTITVTE